MIYLLFDVLLYSTTVSLISTTVAVLLYYSNTVPLFKETFVGYFAPIRVSST